jgi:hypothetical protein
LASDFADGTKNILQRVTPYMTDLIDQIDAEIKRLN